MSHPLLIFIANNVPLNSEISAERFKTVPQTPDKLGSWNFSDFYCDQSSIKNVDLLASVVAAKVSDTISAREQEWFYSYENKHCFAVPLV